MSRQIGGVTQWGTATWGHDTWAVTTPQTTLMQRLQQSPAITAGLPVDLGSHLRLVVQWLSNTPTGAAKWGSAKWNTDVWPADVGDWTDVTSRVRALDWTIGTSDPGAKSQVGTATVTLDNLDGSISPWLPGSLVRAGLIVRFGIVDSSSGSFFPFFTGKAEDTPETVSENVDSWVDVQIVELSADLAGVPADSTIVSGRSLSAVILQQLLEAGWPYGIAFTAPIEDAQVCSALLQDTSSYERISLLCDGLHWDFCTDGRGQLLVFTRHLSDLDPDPILGNFDPDTQVPIASAQPYSSVARIVNTLTGSCVGGVEVARADTRSQARFGVIDSAYGFPEDGLVLVDEDAVTALMDRVLSLRAWDDRGIGSVTLNADIDPEVLLPVMTTIAAFGRDARPCVVQWKHPSGSVLTEFVCIEGQHHNITKQGSRVLWTADLSTGHSGEVSEG